MPTLADRVKETCSAPGTNSAFLLGAVAGYHSFEDAFPGGAINVSYAIVDQSGPNWETGTGEYFAGTLIREFVSASSNGGALVDFASGTQDVFVTVLSENVEHASVGYSLAMSRGWAMP